MPFKHGETRTPLYVLWDNMRRRCRDKNSNNYKWYGAKGISVCDEWQVYTAFAKWARKHGYAEGLYIDRIDPLGNYEPKNCRFVNSRINNLNKMLPNNFKFGVRMRRGKYAASIRIHRKSKHIGTFNTHEEAKAAYLKEFKKERSLALIPHYRKSRDQT